MLSENDTPSTIEWVQQNGEEFTALVATDNRARPAVHVIRGWRYHRVDAELHRIGVLLSVGDPSPLRQPEKAIYLYDDGHAVLPYYVAFHGLRLDAPAPYVGLHPFPLSEGWRPDGRPIDMSGWQLGPARAYHLKVVAS